MEIDITENRTLLKDKIYYSYGKKGYLKRNYKTKIIKEVDYYLEVLEEIPYKDIY